jgi:hypothetical protein
MPARLPRRGPRRRAVARKASARLWRLAAVLAALTCALLASAAVPAAFATILPDGAPQATGVPATATAQQPDKPSGPATASPCSEVCSGGGYGLGAGAPGPCSEVCSGGGYGLVGPPSRTPGDSSADNTGRTPSPGVRVVTDSAGFHWGDAGLGAGGMLGLIAIGLGGALTLTRRRHHRIHS